MKAWLPVLRRLLRALHRDAGYFVVGLTFVYALSGLAVNHIADWDPNYTQQHREVPLSGLPSTLPDQAEAEALTQRVLPDVATGAEVEEVFLLSPTEVEVTLASGRVIIDLEASAATVDLQKPRFILRVVNWLHLNRGKKAWTYIADGYAVLLLFLAASGLFLGTGRRGLLGRGGLMTLLGVGLPAAYVILSGGP